MSATPRPWSVEEFKPNTLSIVGRIEQDVCKEVVTQASVPGWQEDAELIVRAVNSHDALVEALVDAAAQCHSIHWMTAGARFADCALPSCSKYRNALRQAGVLE